MQPSSRSRRWQATLRIVHVRGVAACSTSTFITDHLLHCRHHLHPPTLSCATTPQEGAAKQPEQEVAGQPTAHQKGQFVAACYPPTL